MRSQRSIASSSALCLALACSSVSSGPFIASTMSFMLFDSSSTISLITFSRKAFFSASIGFASDGVVSIPPCETDHRKIAS
eukprot:04589_4